MEILFRRFGKEQLETKVDEFMQHDQVRHRRAAAAAAAAAHSHWCARWLSQDNDRELSFSEFLLMDRKNDIAGTMKHPGFRLSAGMIATTRAENERLLKQIKG